MRNGLVNCQASNGDSPSPTMNRSRRKTVASSQNAASESATPGVPRRQVVKVTPPQMRTIEMAIVGTAPYLQCRFSQKAQNQIMIKQQQGDQEGKGKRRSRPPRDYQSDYEGSMHKFPDGTCGIPANAFRKAAIDACRLVNFKMTLAKLSIFVVGDGYDVVDAMPLVKINGKPELHQMMGRNTDGSCDVRTRAIFKKWSATLRVRFDADQFGLDDVVNLFSRVGEQVGIGEGRPNGRNSSGMGFGLFEVKH